MKYRIDTNYIEILGWKMTLLKLEAAAFPQNNKIKAKSTKSDFGDDLNSINFHVWGYSDAEYKEGCS